MFGLGPKLTNGRAAVSSISLSFFFTLAWLSVGYISKEFKELLFLRVFVCCLQRWRHAHGDAALVAEQHRNVGGRISCP